MFSRRSFYRIFLPLLTVCFALPAVPSGAAPPPADKSERPELALQLGHSKSIYALSYSPDGSQLASGSSDNTVKLWDANTRELLRTLEGHLAPVRGVSYSRDGKTLATGDENGDIKLWNPLTGALQKQLPRLLVGVRGLAYSPDGKFLAAACGYRGTGQARDERGQWVVWNASTWKVVHTAKSDTAWLCLAWSPDGKSLAMGNADRSCSIIDRESAEVRVKLAERKNTPDSIAYSPDGNTLGSLDGAFIQLWSPQTGEAIKRIGAPNTSRTYAFSFVRAGNAILTVSRVPAADSKLERGALVEKGGFATQLWDVESGKQLNQWPERTLAYALALSPDQSIAATGAAAQIRLRSLPGGVADDSDAFASRRPGMGAVAWSRDGKTIASANGAPGEILLWDTDSGSLRRILRGHNASGMPDALAFAPVSNTLVSACGDRSGAEIFVWNITNGQVLQRLRSPTIEVNSIAFSPDSRLFVTAGTTRVGIGKTSSEQIDLWATQTGAHLKTWVGQPGLVQSLAWSPDGKTLACAQSGAPWSPGQPGDNRVTLRDARTGDVVFSLKGHTDNISAVAFSPDGKAVASAGKDKSIRLWNARTGQLTRTLLGHSDWIRRVQFSPDGKLLISAGKDNSIREWNVATGKLQRVLTGHESDVIDVVLSPDGKRIASGSSDTSVRVWNTGDGRELAAMVTAPDVSDEAGSSTESKTLWLTTTPEGYYNCAEGADYVIKWRFGGKLVPFYHFEETYRRPDLLRRALQGQRLTERPLLYTRVPPAIRFITPVNGQDVVDNTLTVLVEAADDAELKNSSFAFYANGNRIPDEIAKPIVVDGKPIIVDGKPIVVDGKPILVDGKPIVVDGKPIVTDGKPITADGRGPGTIKKVLAEAVPALNDGGPVMSRYPFHRLYTMKIPLPPGEENVVLRATVSDSEVNKSDDAVTIRHLNTAPVKGDLYLVSVGVSSYRNPLYNINYAASDAHSIAQVLSQQKGLQYKQVYCKVLDDKKATKSNIALALAGLKKAGPEDTVMVFLSGHGIQTNGKTYFAPWGIFVRDIPGTCLQWSEIVDNLSGLYARKLLFTDACHSGAKLGAAQATSAQLAETVRRESGLVMLASSQSDEFSFEDKEGKQGTFSLALAEAFSGKADLDGDGKITLPEIAMYVPKRVSEATKGLQNPQLVLVQDFDPQGALVKVPRSANLLRAMDGQLENRIN